MKVLLLLLVCVVSVAFAGNNRGFRCVPVSFLFPLFFSSPLASLFTFFLSFPPPFL